MLSLEQVLFPSLVLIGSSIILLPVTRLLTRLWRRTRGGPLGIVCLAYLFSAVGLYWLNRTFIEQGGSSVMVSVSNDWLLGASSSFLIDSMSIYMLFVYILCGFATSLYGILNIDSRRVYSERYYSIMLIVAGCIMAASLSGDLLTLFIFWEAASAGTYMLIVYGKTSQSLEASLKYFVMIIVASGLIVYGLSLIYGLTGSLNFWRIKEVLLKSESKGMLLGAFVFVIGGYAIETAIVPFHMWLPDAYTAAPASSAAFLSALVDQGSYYVLMRILIYVLTPPFVVNWPMTLAVFSAMTMTVGNLFALIQKNVKRMVSYVCIADIGYNLIAITSATGLGLMANLFFFLIGGLTTALCFMTIGILNRHGIKDLEDFSGAGRRFPLTSAALTVAALSFPGIPPLAGFFAKYLVFTSAIEGGMLPLALLGVMNSVIEASYFLRLIQYLFMKSPNAVREKEDLAALVPVYLLVCLIFILGIYPTPIIDLIYPAILQSPLRRLGL